jgi:hypothetical protein
MARTAPCLAAMSGQPPEPGGSRRKARGVDGESACQATIVPGHYAANVTAFCVAVDPLSPLKFPIRFVQLIQGGALFAMRHSPHQLISGRDRIPYQGPSCIVARAQGSKGMGPICYAAYCSPAKTRSHIHLGNGTIVLSSLRRFYLLLRTAPSGTTPVSR